MHPADDASCPAASQVAIAAGKTYLLRAQGTYQAKDYPPPYPQHTVADARYTSVNGGAWSDIEEGGESYLGGVGFDLQARADAAQAPLGPFVSPDWGAYNEEHHYRALWVAPALATDLCLRTNDPLPDDNIGSLAVDVCEVLCGGPGQGCCSDGSCQAGNSCDASNRCMPCGGAGGPTCCGQVRLAGNSTQEVALAVTPGLTYQLTVSGQYTLLDSGSYQVLADALCVFDGKKYPVWDAAFGTCSDSFSCPLEYLDLQAQGATGFVSPLDAGTTCRADHVYPFSLVGPDSGMLKLRIDNQLPGASGSTVDYRSTTTGGLTVSYCLADSTSCDDGNPCTDDLIENGRCVHPAVAAGTACADDGNPCTLDVCDVATGQCSHPAAPPATVCRAASGECDLAEQCTGSPSICPADGYASAQTICNQHYRCSGTSSQCPTSCSQDTQCAPNHSCVSGSCVPSTAGPDGSTCTTDAQCQSGNCIDGTCCATRPGTACSTGLPGVCAAGTTTCVAGVSQCMQTVQPAPAERCINGLDDDCNGQVDEGCVCSPYTSIACYTGPAGTQYVGLCHGGTQLCNASGTGYGTCNNQVVPVPESCHTAGDDNCNGQSNEGCTATSCNLYTETFGTNGIPRDQTTDYYRLSWCGLTASPTSNMPLCFASGGGMRTNPGSDEILWVSRGTSTCSSVRLTFRWYQYLVAGSSIRYQTSNDSYPQCSSQYFFTTALTLPLMTQTCVAGQTVTIPFNNSSGVYIQFHNGTSGGSSGPATWYDDVRIELQGCPCN